MPGALTWDPTPPGGSQSTSRGGVNPAADGASLSSTEVAATRALVSADEKILAAAAAAPVLGYEQAADAYRPSPNYRIFVRAIEGSGVAKSLAGRGFGEAGAGNDVMWGTAGYISSKATTAGTDGGIKFGPDICNWNLPAGNSLILAFTVNGSAPAGTVRAVGTCRQSSTPGIGLGFNTSGQIIFNYANGSAAAAASASTAAALNGSPQKVVLMIDGRTKLVYLWINDEWTDLTYQIGIGASGTSLNTAQHFCFGNVGNPSLDATLAASWTNIHMLTLAGELPSNRASLARFLLRDMSRAIPAYMLNVARPDEYANPVNTNATAATKAKYRLLKRYNGEAEYMIGINERHHSWPAPKREGLPEVLQTISGKLPAFVGWLYHDIAETETTAENATVDGVPTAGYPIGTGAQRNANLIADIKEWHRNGGLNHMYLAPGSPLSAKGMGQNLLTDSYRSSTPGVSSIKTGGAQEAQFLAYMDRLATFLQSLTDDQGNLIPIVLRPFLEMNNGTFPGGAPSGFWWSGNNQSADMILIWRKMYDYMTTTKGINNIIWNWNMMITDSPTNSPIDNSNFPYTNWYPGDAYVDLISFDFYKDDAFSATASYSMYNKNIRNNFNAYLDIARPSRKPVAFFEVGARYAQGNVGIWDRWGAEIAEFFREACIVGLWRSPWGPAVGDASAPSYATWNSRDYCITLDKLPVWKP